MAEELDELRTLSFSTARTSTGTGSEKENDSVQNRKVKGGKTAKFDLENLSSELVGLQYDESEPEFSSMSVLAKEKERERKMSKLDQEANARCMKYNCASRHIFLDFPYLPKGPPHSLIKYNRPVLTAVRNKNGAFISQNTEASRKPISFESITNLFRTSKTHCILKLTSKEKKDDAILNEGELINLLNHLYEPIQWRDDNSAYSKKVSHERSTPTLIIAMVVTLVQVLESDFASKFTVADTIRKLLIEAFDECIRQIILDCPIRGILLRRIRDHLITDMESRRALYLSAVAYAVRMDLRMRDQIEKVRVMKDHVIRTKTKLQAKLKSRREEKARLETEFAEYKENDAQEQAALLVSYQSEKRRLLTVLHRYTATEDEDSNASNVLRSSLSGPAIRAGSVDHDESASTVATGVTNTTNASNRTHAVNFN